MYERNKDIYSRNGVKRVVIIGSGNVAEALAKAIGASRYELVQIYARNRERGQAIARAVRCACADDPKRIAEADIYLMAVSDRAVPKLSESFDFGDAVVAHTAGSVALGELAPRIRNKGVFYPLQTFTAGRSLELSDVPLFIEGNNDFTVDALAGLAGALSTRVRIADSRQRMRLHLAAVFACNFANHMFAVGQQLLQEYGLSADLIKPLIRETVAKALDSPSAAAVQTGPARRNDYRTRHKHIEMLHNHPELQNLYKNISLNIWETSKKI